MHAFRRRIIDIKQVSEDPLTHAYSKAYYDKHGSELDENTGISYSVVAIDLDKFKKSTITTDIIVVISR
jgi:GGDEF domain-containing protein